jgi:flagellar assembly factor FliW
MPFIATTHFGPLDCNPEALIHFPDGLPGFEEERRFVPLEIPEHAPLVFLQSLATPSLCFLTVPVAAVAPDYRLQMAPEELTRIGLDPRRAPAVGRDVLCLAIVTVGEDAVTANLRAPLVIALEGRRAAQSIQPEGRYSHRQPLEAPEAALCS